MTDGLSLFLGWVTLIALIIGPMVLGEWYGRLTVMEDAFDRGYAVQCVGERGYHWECEND